MSVCLCACAWASLEVLWVLGEGHLDDVQGIVVVLLGGQQQSQQVEGVDVVPLQLQGLPHVAQRLRDLHTHMLLEGHSLQRYTHS